MIQERPEVHIVAEKARETFNKIKKLNRESPKFTRQQKDNLQTAIQKEKDDWWESVKELMKEKQ